MRGSYIVLVKSYMVYRVIGSIEKLFFLKYSKLIILKWFSDWTLLSRGLHWWSPVDGFLVNKFDHVRLYLHLKNIC